MILGQARTWNGPTGLHVLGLTPLFEWRLAMIARHLNKHHYDWKHLVDYETFWVLAFTAVVIGGGIFALFSIAQHNPQALP
jgi:hypothetical protein